MLWIDMDTDDILIINLYDVITCTCVTLLMIME